MSSIDFPKEKTELKVSMIYALYQVHNTQIILADDPDYEWGEVIWNVLGEYAFGFFWAMRAFEKCFDQGIEIDQDQLDHWNVTNDDLIDTFKERKISFYIKK